ncbi:hypothetical protein Tco_0112122 [Tanacetum coccineum]
MMYDHNSFRPEPQRQEIVLLKYVFPGSFLKDKWCQFRQLWTPCPWQNVCSYSERTNSSQQGLEFLFSPLLKEYYNPAHGHAEDNNNDQAPNASFQEAKFIYLFVTVNCRMNFISSTIEKAGNLVDNTIWQDDYKAKVVMDEHKTVRSGLIIWTIVTPLRTPLATHKPKLDVDLSGAENTRFILDQSDYLSKISEGSGHTHHFSDADHAGFMLDTQKKSTLVDAPAMSAAEFDAEVRGVICKLCSSNGG